MCNPRRKRWGSPLVQTNEYKTRAHHHTYDDIIKQNDNRWCCGASFDESIIDGGSWPGVRCPAALETPMKISLSGSEIHFSSWCQINLCLFTLCHVSCQPAGRTLRSYAADIAWHLRSLPSSSSRSICHKSTHYDASRSNKTCCWCDHYKLLEMCPTYCPHSWSDRHLTMDHCIISFPGHHGQTLQRDSLILEIDKY